VAAKKKRKSTLTVRGKAKLKKIGKNRVILRKLAAVENSMMKVIDNTGFTQSFTDNPEYKRLDKERDKLIGQYKE
jgi:hypothetical protein